MYPCPTDGKRTAHVSMAGCFPPAGALDVVKDTAPCFALPPYPGTFALRPCGLPAHVHLPGRWQTHRPCQHGGTFPADRGFHNKKRPDKIRTFQSVPYPACHFFANDLPSEQAPSLYRIHLICQERFSRIVERKKRRPAISVSITGNRHGPVINKGPSAVAITVSSLFVPVMVGFQQKAWLG